ncbi:DUF2199 domain-containing protein [Micromonospora endophytica]|uniref:DUF2199 domain-containing protein n=1 Tax=Micromonospora endophytica TaxID=515350 RepID=A0A2W2CUQ7_9ACTN|nr:DUF2199 domain-containing protein [Micromonospora endophytica]PZF92119.1 DUF2199 domain-containing protein [Micromonospora endophytica]RIW42850.1 DUF2199 domain-containing protein [Micromonospora endophytica]BCJ61640.1 hypothetical protein Jiend_50620 [Micromonospora endophytica]
MIDHGFVCGGCGQRHDGLPFSYGAPAPAYWRNEFDGDEYSVLEDETCLIHGQHYFVRARLVIPVLDAEEDFEWGVWVSLSKDNFRRTVELWTTPGREQEPAYFGWLSTQLPAYPMETLNLKAEVHTDQVGTRPHVVLEPTDHPLAVEQRTGITVARVQEIAELLLHA